MCWSKNAEGMTKKINESNFSRSYKIKCAFPTMFQSISTFYKGDPGRNLNVQCFPIFNTHFNNIKNFCKKNPLPYGLGMGAWPFRGRTSGAFCSRRCSLRLRPCQVKGSKSLQGPQPKIRAIRPLWWCGCQLPIVARQSPRKRGRLTDICRCPSRRGPSRIYIWTEQ